MKGFISSQLEVNFDELIYLLKTFRFLEKIHCKFAGLAISLLMSTKYLSQHEKNAEQFAIPEISYLSFRSSCCPFLYDLLYSNSF